MEKEKIKKIVEFFIQKNKLITPELLEFLLTTKNYEKIMSELSERENFILTKNDLTSFETKKDKIKILLNITERPSEVSVEDFVKFYQDKYNRIKNIITQRFDYNFISLDKIPNNETSFIIVMIHEVKKEADRTTLVVEDLTKKEEVIFLRPVDVDIDDVVIITCRKQGNVIYGERIEYPGIPLRQPTKGYGKVCIISDLHLDEAPLGEFEKFVKKFSNSDIKYLIVAGDIGDCEKFKKMISDLEDKIIFVIPGNKDCSDYPALPLKIDLDNVVSLSNPSMIEINGIKFLLIHKFTVEMLEKRYLNIGDKTRFIFEKDYLVLEHVPDVVAFGHTHAPNVMNYKSITLVNPGSLLSEFKPVVLDLSTREYSMF